MYYSQNIKRVVVKVGTSTLTHSTGKLDFKRIDSLCRVLSDLKNSGKDVVLVTSGAIGVGLSKLGLSKRPDDIPGKQAIASIGQGELMHVYEKSFGEYGNIVAQILLTRSIVEEKECKKNVINTFRKLFEFGAIPIVNENDAVAVEEMMFGVFGENDTLSAVVATLCEADLLIILSDIDGLYDADPRSDEGAKLIPLVKKITPEIESIAGGAGSSRGTGGMATKIEAAKIAMEHDIYMVITNGDAPNNIYDIVEGRIRGTLFDGGGQNG